MQETDWGDGETNHAAFARLYSGCESRSLHQIWSHRLGARILAFQAGDTGSNPVETAKERGGAR